MLNFRGWWEYYFLRYFVGTIVGAVIVFGSSRIPFQSWLNASTEWKAMTAFAALGFAYCYIASAPMLTFHVTRVYLLDSPKKLVWWLISIGGSFVLGILAISYTSNCYYYRLITLIPPLIVVTAQLFSLRMGCRDKYCKFIKFYRNLSTARVREVPHPSGMRLDPSVTEYVESYRHIREHSNALSIIVIELILAPVLFAWFGSPSLVICAMVWLLPPACCWALSAWLELDLTR